MSLAALSAAFAIPPFKGFSQTSVPKEVVEYMLQTRDKLRAEQPLNYRLAEAILPEPKLFLDLLKADAATRKTHIAERMQQATDLLAQGANPDTVWPLAIPISPPDKYSLDAVPLLHMCCLRAVMLPSYRDHYLSLFKLLLDRGADKDCKSTPSQEEPLIVYATRLGLGEFVEELIRRQARVNAQDIDGDTALHYAYGLNNNTLVNKLKAAGASETIRNNEKKTPRQVRGQASPQR